ncbi:MAG: FHA domain-containing protein [Gemmatimonadetes bacterium]|nr:FHA domain-containing protein [Gemmatimonadota bacterium]
MATLQLGDKQITLRAGDMTVGSGPGMDIEVPGAANAQPFAVVTTRGDGSVAVRRGFEGAPVKVNAIMLGVEPTPMIHGDKLEVAGHTLGFSDEKKSGSTQFLSGADLAELAKLRQQAAAGGKGGAPTASTGGRLVSLTDGREYAIPAKGLTLGREATCDVVIASGEVSRNHAEIASGPDGYYVIDTSTNGVWVNGRRVEGTQTLGRADVIKMGPEEFRFYADKASAAAGAATVPGPAVPPPVAAPTAAAPAPAPVPVPKAPAPAAKAPAPAAAPAKPAAATPATPRPTVSKAPTPSKSGRPSVVFWVILAVLVAGGAAAYFLLFN